MKIIVICSVLFVIEWVVSLNSVYVGFYDNFSNCNQTAWDYSVFLWYDSSGDCVRWENSDFFRTSTCIDGKFVVKTYSDSNCSPSSEIDSEVYNMKTTCGSYQPNYYEEDTCNFVLPRNGIEVAVYQTNNTVSQCDDEKFFPQFVAYSIEKCIKVNGKGPGIQSNYIKCVDENTVQISSFSDSQCGNIVGKVTATIGKSCLNAPGEDFVSFKVINGC